MKRGWWRKGSISRPLQPAASGRWFACKHCGAAAAYFPDGMEDIPAGSVLHTKPAEHINKRPVACVLYQQLEPAEFWLLHQNAPSIEPPMTLLQPISEGTDE